MFDLIKRLLCRHRNLRFVRNLYGDQITHSGYKRSEWKCKHCGAWVLKSALHDDAAQEKDAAHQPTKEQ